MTPRSSPPSLATLSRCRGVSLPPLSLGGCGCGWVCGAGTVFFSLAVRLGSHFMHIFQPGKPVDCFGTAGDSSRKVLDPQRWLRRDTCKETARSDARLSAAHILTGKVSHQLRAGQKKVSEPAFSYELLQNCCTF